MTRVLPIPRHARDGYGPRTEKVGYHKALGATDPARGRKAKRKAKGSGSGGRGGRH